MFCSENKFRAEPGCKSKDSNGKRKELTENAENERITGRQVSKLSRLRQAVLMS